MNKEPSSTDVERGEELPGRTGGLRVEPFTVSVDESVLDDLRERLRGTRWPPGSWDQPWEQGTDRSYLEGLLDYWANEFDWRTQERRLNRFEHFLAEVDGVRLHFVRHRARGGDGIPLVLTHGWPSAFVEFLEVAPMLADPSGHGIDGPAFDVIIPSLPGYGFSQRPAAPVTYRDVARLWHGLMGGLGYERYGAAGGDFGSGVTTFMALDEPRRLLGIYLTDLEISPYVGPEARPLSQAEQDYLDAGRQWSEAEAGYKVIQSTKPQTVAYSLNDSPAGLAAWMVEKWRSWSDSGGDVDARFSRDFLLTIITLYWATGTIATSMRDYFDNRRWPSPPPVDPADFVEVPTGVGVFSNQFVAEGTPPREWAERLYDVRRWTPMASGGHFAAAEEPDLVARDLAAFFATDATS